MIFSYIKKWRKFSDCLNGQLSTHKFFEIEWQKYDKPENIFWINFRWSIRGDHAGLHIELELLWFSISFKIYDHRHWNYTDDCWESCDEYDHR